MQYIVRATSSFDAAHQLPDDAVYGPRCARLHGHHWRIEVAVRGSMGPRKIPSVELTQLNAALNDLCREYDGRDLTQMMPATRSTPENVAILLMERLQLGFLGLVSVTVWEREGTSVTVEKEPQ